MSRALVLSLFLIGCGPAGSSNATRPIPPSTGDERDPAALTGISDDDGDNFPNDSDGCPAGPEDADNFEDDDGCPDPDNDQDGFVDAQDGCPNVPEAGGETPDGCPD